MSFTISPLKGKSLSKYKPPGTADDELILDLKKPELSNSIFSKSRTSTSPVSKLKEAYLSPTHKNLEHSKKLGLSRHSSSKLISEIFSPSVNKEPESKNRRVFLMESSLDSRLGSSDRFNKREIKEKSQSAYNGSQKTIQSSFDEFPNPSVLRSDIDKISKEFSMVYRKNNSEMLQKEKLIEENKAKDSEIMKYKQFSHEIMTKVHGLKIKIASKDSYLSNFAKSSYNESKSIIDLKIKVCEDLDIISSIFDRVFSELFEVNLIKKKEKEMRKSLNELSQRENLLLTKIEAQRNKNSELASIQIEQERSFDKKELYLNREKIELLEKISDLEAALNDLDLEKEEIGKLKNDYFFQVQNLSKQVKKLEIDLSKNKEILSRYQTDLEGYKEKLNDKEAIEELVKIKRKNSENDYSEDQKFLHFTEKIAELEKSLKSKTSELLELKYKQCLSSPKAPLINDFQAKTENLKNKLKELPSFSEGPSEKLIKSQQKEIKVLKISLDLLQKENSSFSLTKEKIVLLESENEDLSGSLKLLKEKISGLEKENDRLRKEIISALGCVESAEKCSVDLNISSKIQREQIQNLLETKQSIIEESENLKGQIEINEKKIDKLKNELKENLRELTQKNFQIDSLSNEINRLKSSIAAKELEVAYFQEKENKFRDQIEDCIQEINKLKIESNKIKGESYKQTQELTIKNYQIEELNNTQKNLKDQVISNVNEIQKLLKELKENQSALQTQKEENSKLSQEITKKHSQVSALTSSEKLLKSHLSEKNEEIEQLLKEIENKNIVFEQISAAKSETERKLIETLNEKSRTEDENLALRRDVIEKEKELNVYLDQEKKVSDEIEEIEKDMKKQKKKSLRPEEEIKFINEEKFRLKSLLVYKDVQIKLLKDKLNGIDSESNKNLKRGASLVGKNK